MSNEENILEFNNLDAQSKSAMPDVTDNMDAEASETPEAEVADDATSADTDEGTAPQQEDDAPKTLHGVLGNKTLEDVIEREAREEQDTTSPFSLSKTLGGVIISRFLQKQIGVVLVVAAFLIIYISLRYTCQQKLVNINHIEKQIEKAHYKATVCSSELTEKSRESSVLKRLAECGDSGLNIPNEPPYLIKIEEN